MVPILMMWSTDAARASIVFRNLGAFGAGSLSLERKWIFFLMYEYRIGLISLYVQYPVPVFSSATVIKLIGPVAGSEYTGLQNSAFP